MASSLAPYPHLFEPGTIGRLRLRNRIVQSAMGTGLAEDGRVGARDLAIQEERAAAGVGLIVFGGTAVHPTSRFPARILIESWDEAVVDSLRVRADAVHRHGAAMIGQLIHLGREAPGGQTEAIPLAPSPIASPRNPSVPREMTHADIREIVEAFGRSAANYAAAGIDGAEVHAAHGYLVAQFLSPASNRRLDDYRGDTPEGRTRFLVEIVEEIRSRCGPDFPVGVRLSADEHTPGGLTLDDTLEIVDVAPGGGSRRLPVDHDRAARGLRQGLELGRGVRPRPLGGRQAARRRPGDRRRSHPAARARRARARGGPGRLRRRRPRPARRPRVGREGEHRPGRPHPAVHRDRPGLPPLRGRRHLHDQPAARARGRVAAARREGRRPRRVVVVGRRPGRPRGGACRRRGGPRGRPLRARGRRRRPAPAGRRRADARGAARLRLLPRARARRASASTCGSGRRRRPATCWRRRPTSSSARRAPHPGPAGVPGRAAAHASSPCGTCSADARARSRSARSWSTTAAASGRGSARPSTSPSGARASRSSRPRGPSGSRSRRRASRTSTAGCARTASASARSRSSRASTARRCGSRTRSPASRRRRRPTSSSCTRASASRTSSWPSSTAPVPALVAIGDCAAPRRLNHAVLEANLALRRFHEGRLGATSVVLF